jgi:DNA ligase-1
MREDGSVEYEVVAKAYRDLEQATGRLMLIDRLATLIGQTPQELLPTICYLCQGQVAPEFAGVDLGLAEKMALRAVATATPAISARPLSSCSRRQLAIASPACR